MAEPFVHLNLPNLAELELEHDWPDVATLIGEYQRLQAEHHKAAATLDELLAARPAAIERDRESYAKAIRDGKDDPGEAALGKLSTKITAAHRRAEAIAVATRAVAADIAALVDRRRSELLRDADRAVAEDYGTLRDAVAAWEAARARLYARKALRSWVQGFPRQSKYVPAAAPGIRALIGPNGDSVTFEELAQALRVDAEPAPAAERAA